MANLESLIRSASPWGPKSQHGGKVPTFEPQESIRIGLMLITLYKNESWELCGELGVAFCSTQLSRRVPNLQKVLPCRRHPCDTRGLGPGALCEVDSPNSHALNG
jgi:hypothetical protein